MLKLNKLYQSKYVQITGTTALFLIYIAYVVFVIRANQGPVDYETFIHLGSRFIRGKEIYIENSYYPLPYVAIFGLLSQIPRPLSMSIWLLGPVIVALFVTRFKPYALLFAPLFSHFTGGQSSIFGLLGFFGFRENLCPSNYLGGIFLSLTLLKPQLGIIPIGYAIYHWIRYIKEKRQTPNQLVSFGITTCLIYLPSFIFYPRWVFDWLSVPRPLFNRAISSAIPRLLFFVSSPDCTFYWILWVLISTGLLFLIWKIFGFQNLDILILTSFIINPLVHDYDLIQLLPTIWGPIMPIASIILSIPGWWTILTHYGSDIAWITFTIIAPGLLATYIYQYRKKFQVSNDSITPAAVDRLPAG